MKIYYYLFYRIYKLWKQLGSFDVAFSATLFLSMLVGINVIILISLLFPEFLTNRDNMVIIVASTVVLLVINYFLFVSNERYKMIEKKFKDETQISKIIGSVLVTLYSFISFVLIFILFADL